MATPYRLLLISESKPDTPENIHSSNQMITWGLCDAFSRMPHVTLTYRDAISGGDIAAWREDFLKQAPVDFTLVHSYAPSPIFNEVDTLRRKTHREIMWISELTCPHFDYSFTFLPSGNEQAPLPALCNVLQVSLEGVVKLSGSVLLDHYWSWPPDYAYRGGPNPNLWCDRLYDWLSVYKDSHVVGQMESPEHERLAGARVPDWVQRVPNAFYTEYLRATAPFENFIMTHPGTYEHSIIDMAARGIRVLVPTPTVRHLHQDGWEIISGGIPFAPKDTIKRLKLPTFSSKEELLALLGTPIGGTGREFCNDMSKITGQIDAHCQKVLTDAH